MLPHCKLLYAYEPLPQMAGLLRKKYISHPRVSVIDMAASDCNGEVILFTPKYVNPGLHRNDFVESWSSIYKNYEDLQTKYPDHFPEIRRTKIKTIRLDDQNLLNIGFIKIDVEGAELEVLKGAKKLLVSQRPNLLIEIEERHRKGSVHQVSDYLKKRGFDCYFVLDGMLHPFKDFSIKTMQQGKIFPGPIDPKYKRYINNFIFIHQEKVDLLKNIAN